MKEKDLSATQLQSKIRRKLRTVKRDNNLKLRSRFLGKIDGFESKEERAYENYHLRAYLKGKNFFKARSLKEMPHPTDPKLPNIPAGTFMYFPVLKELNTEK